MKSQLLQSVLAGGLSAGVLDITAACLNAAWRNGSSPVRVFQSVAGGWLGTATFQGGWQTAALGLLFHFLIATIWAAVFSVISLKLPVLRQRALLAGALYGGFVYLFMYGMVLPLSAYHTKFFNQPVGQLLTSLLIHVVCVGLPIALAARRFLITP